MLKQQAKGKSGLSPSEQGKKVKMKSNNLPILVIVAVMCVLFTAAFIADAVNTDTVQDLGLADSTNPKQPTTAVVLVDTIRSAKSPADSISTASGYANYKYVMGTFKNISSTTADTLKFYYVSQTGDTSLAGFYKNANTSGVPDTMLVLGTTKPSNSKTIWMDKPFPFRVLGIKVSTIANSGMKATWELQNDR